MIFNILAQRNGAAHVATTRRLYNGKTCETLLLRRPYRDGDKVQHDTLGNLSHLPTETIDLIRRSLRVERFVAPRDRVEIVRSLPHGHVAAVLAALRARGVDCRIKTLDLHVRPIHHRSKKRVRAHVLLCMLADYVQWHMQRAWASMRFANEHAPGRTGSSPVSSTQRSSAANQNAITKQRPDGQPVHSFRTLLAELASIAKHHVCPVGGDDTTRFELTTIPTPIQREALDRLGITGRV